MVPYRGGAPALADFLSGKVDFTFGAVPTIKPHIEGGKARGLGVTRGRAPQLPDIPGMDEIGYGSVDSASEMGLIVPAATPPAIVERLQKISAEAVKDPAFRATLAGARLPAYRQHHGRIPRPCRPRDREMDQDHRCGKHQAGIAAALAYAALLRRLGLLGDANEIAQHRRGAVQALAGLLPVVEQHDLHVGPHPRRRALLADEGDQAFRIGEGAVAERQHRALRPGLDLLDVGAAAQRLDGDDLKRCSTSSGSVPKRSTSSAPNASISCSSSISASRR